MKIPPLTAQEIFGIYVIVLIIQLSFDVFSHEPDILVKYLGVVSLSTSLSALMWRKGIPLIMNNVVWKKLILKPTKWFYIISLAVLALSLALLFKVV
jgi:hypothetical protein